MNFIRKNFYLISFAILALFVSTILIFRPKEPAVPPLKDRIGGTALGAEWMNTKQAIEGLIQKVSKDPKDMKSRIQLAQGYIQEGRITGDYNYYDAAALKLLDEVLEKDPKNFEALCSKATVLLNQHHFQQGYEVGLKAQQQNPHAAFAYGILTDANVELGKYDEAVKMGDSMCAIRPDLRSYSRISYLREIYGDYNGAKEAMKMAVKAGVPGLEQTEWCRVYLGKLYEQTGNIDTAEMIYTAASVARPNYAPALAALGRVERAKKNYSEAIKYFIQAQALVKDYSYGDELADLYRITGQKEKADSTSQEVIKLLQAHANSNDQNADVGHYADKELAYAYLKMNENDLALQHAKAEYNRRPDNIDVNEMMAWVHYKRGEFADAVPFAEKSLRTGSRNSELLCRAGLIYCQANQVEKGSALISEAVKQNPFLQEDLLAEAKKFIPGIQARLAVN
jgi:tetratricopeptide (TPR) repeat protein